MSHPFRTAVEADDHDAVAATLHPDVSLHSPVAFRPFEGREATSAVLYAVSTVFEDFEYTDELEGPSSVALLFRARVGDKSVQGVDYLELDDDGSVEKLTVLIRPLSGVLALQERMAPMVEGVAKGASA